MADGITARIRDALMSDIAEITAVNGFSKTLAESGRLPKRPEEAALPAVFLEDGGGGTSELDTLSNAQGSSEQQFNLLAVVSAVDETGLEDIEDLTRDIRNVVERPAGNLQALGDVVASGWSSIVTEQVVSNGIYLRHIQVVVQYNYQRGSA
jgi:hypothetical protein